MLAKLMPKTRCLAISPPMLFGRQRALDQDLTLPLPTSGKSAENTSSRGAPPPGRRTTALDHDGFRSSDRDEHLISEKAGLDTK